MKLVCGLGNPGREHAGQRHNVGFQVVGLLAARLGSALDQEKFEGRLGQATVGAERVLLLEPLTFMNLSGRSVSAAARFYKLFPDDVLVIHDELDLTLGRLQLKQGGGSGGHNGLKSIVEWWGQEDFARLRIGVGKPEGPDAKERVVGHVLSPFSTRESVVLPAIFERAADAALAWAEEGLAAAMNSFNRRST